MADALDTLANITSAAADYVLSAYNVRHYGATGNDSTNDTSFFNAAMAAMPATGGVLYIPPGNYRLLNWNITKPCVVIGPPTAELRIYDPANNNSAYILQIDSSDVVVDGFTVRGEVSEESAPAPYYDVLLGFDNVSGSPHERVRIRNLQILNGRYTLSLSKAKDLWVTGNRIDNSWEHGIVGPPSCDRVTIKDNIVTNSRNNAGIRIGALTDATPINDLIVDGNIFYRCGVDGPQDGIDISTAQGARVRVTNNIVEDCGDGIELKIGTDGDAYTDIVIGNNTLTSSGEDYFAGIRCNFTNPGDSEDHLRRVLIHDNLISHFQTAFSPTNYGIVCNAHTNVTIRDNDVTATYPIYLLPAAGGLDTVRPIVRGNRTTGSYGLYAASDSDGRVVDAVIDDNDFTYVHAGIRSWESSSPTPFWDNPRITNNRFRQGGEGSGLQAIVMTGLQGAVISGNDILTSGPAVQIDTGKTNTSVVVTQNVIDSSAGSGAECVKVLAATGTVQIFDNTLFPKSGSRGWTSSGAGATVLGGANTRGVSTAIPTLAGSLGDTFYDSTPAAGATKWVCTTAGGSGVAVWTAQ